MLVACRLAGLPALEGYYEGGKAGAQGRPRNEENGIAPGVAGRLRLGLGGAALLRKMAGLRGVGGFYSGLNGEAGLKLRRDPRNESDPYRLMMGQRRADGDQICVAFMRRDWLRQPEDGGHF